MNPLKLAVIQPPLHDESLLGYLYRLARLNAVSGAELLAAFRNLKQGEAEAWMAWQDAPQCWKLMTCELLEPETRSCRVWDCRRHKFCPDCLVEHPYWRASWNLMLTNGCTRHRTVLVESCPSCGSRLHAESMRTLCCEYCSHNLADPGHVVYDADVGTLWLAKELGKRLLKPARFGRHMASPLNLDEFHELALRFGVRGMNADRDHPVNLKDAGVPSFRRTVAEIAGNILMDWPRGFFHLLDMIRARSAERPGWKIGQCLGPIYSDIYSHLGNSSFDFVRSAFEDYLRDQWDAPLALRNRNLNPELIRQHRWVSIDEAARELKVESSLLERMAKSGEIPSRTCEHEKNRMFRVIDISVAKSLSSSIRNALTVEQATAQAKLNKQRIRQLLDAGLLSVFGGKPTSGERWWIDARSIERLSTGAVLSDITSRSASMAHLLKHRISGRKEFIALIKAIRDGQLHVCIPSESASPVGSWLLDEIEFDLWLSSIRAVKSSAHSVVEVAAKLGVKQEVAYALVRTGLLESEVVQKGRRAFHQVTTTAIQRFRKHFVLGTELAHISGMSPKVVAHQLRTTGCIPAAGPTSEERKCRQYVWRRTRKLMIHVARLAINHTS